MGILIKIYAVAYFKFELNFRFRQKRWLNSQNRLFVGKVVLEPMSGYVGVSELDALMYVVLSKREKTRAVWGIS
jgi:hypothetical protein